MNDTTDVTFLIARLAREMRQMKQARETANVAYDGDGAPKSSWHELNGSACWWPLRHTSMNAPRQRRARRKTSCKPHMAKRENLGMFRFCDVVRKERFGLQHCPCGLCPRHRLLAPSLMLLGAVVDSQRVSTGQE